MTGRPTVQAPRLLTDAHLADYIAAAVLRERFCWAGPLGWLGWDGRRWSEIPEPVVVDAVRQHFIELHAREARGGADQDRLRELTRLLSRSRITAVTALTQGVVRKDPRAFDAAPDLLNVANGVVDLRTGKLRAHDPKLLLTKLSPVEYRPGANCDDWQQALEVLPEDVRDYMQVRLGQAATGHAPPDDVLPVLMGGGENGKTAFLGAVSRALGDYAVLVSDRVLFSSADAHPTDLVDLRGARLALIEETPEARRLNVARLKKVVGTPEITARRIRQDPITFTTTHSLFVTTNYRPVVEETDHGTWRRLALVRFPFTFRKPGDRLLSDHDRRADPGLRERVKTSAQVQQAVLRWLVEGARRWYVTDRVMPCPPAAVVCDTRAWRIEADFVLAFLDERLVIDPDSNIQTTDLLSEFNAWLAERGQREWGDRTFSARFRDHDAVTGASILDGRARPGPGTSRAQFRILEQPADRYRAWLGVRFRTPADDLADAPGTAGTAGSEYRRTPRTRVGNPNDLSQPSQGAFAQVRGGAA